MTRTDGHAFWLMLQFCSCLSSFSFYVDTFFYLFAPLECVESTSASRIDLLFASGFEHLLCSTFCQHIRPLPICGQSCLLVVRCSFVIGVSGTQSAAERCGCVAGQTLSEDLCCVWTGLCSVCVAPLWLDVQSWQRPCGFVVRVRPLAWSSHSFYARSNVVVICCCGGLRPTHASHRRKQIQIYQQHHDSGATTPDRTSAMTGLHS